MDEFVKKLYDLTQRDVDSIQITRNLLNAKSADLEDRIQRQEFIKYLISVATHPIGLHASSSPLNQKEENMLAYIMDMFSISDTKLRKLVQGSAENTDRENQVAINVKKEFVSRKRHSWRPELRIRLGAPEFFYNRDKYLKSLQVRVFVFPKEKVKKDTPAKATQKSVLEQRAAIALGKIFKNLKPRSEGTIRSSKEVRGLLRFEPRLQVSRQTSSINLFKSSYSMVQSTVNGSETKGKDLHLNIKRYQCDPETAHILRFEFWLDSNIGNQNWVNILSNAFRVCKSSTCRNVNFYGSIEVDLSSIPSYTLEQNFPIISPREIEINSCKIFIEPRNRRIQDFNQEQADPNSDKKSSELFLLNHVRLYANCFMYQALTFASSLKIALGESLLFRNITLDNLLYLPAYSLINQSRLQSNLSKTEDSCLRRMAILLILMKLDKQINDKSADGSISSVIVMLMSVIHNEYIIARGSIDSIDVPKSSLSQENSSDDQNYLMIRRELDIVKDFTDRVIDTRLNRHLFLENSEISKIDIDKAITLSSLKLCKLAISYFINVGSVTSPFRHDATVLKKSIERKLCTLFVERMKKRIETILNQNHKDMMTRKKLKMKTVSSDRTNTVTQSGDSWRSLLHDIKHLNHDLCLNWSRTGLDSIIGNADELISSLNFSKSLNNSKYRSLLEQKISKYLEYKLDA